MTVKELRKYLNKYPNNARVIITGHGYWSHIEESLFELKENCSWLDHEPENTGYPVLIIGDIS